MCVRALTAAVIGAFCWAGSLSADVIFDSDATINYAIDEDVWFMGADDESGDDPPIFNVIDPADLSGTIRLRKSLLANFSGGTISGQFSAYGETVPAILNFSGTRFEKKVSVIYGVVANVSGGEFYGQFTASAVANVSGGDFYTDEYDGGGLSLLAASCISPGDACSAERPSGAGRSVLSREGILPAG